MFVSRLRKTFNLARFPRFGAGLNGMRFNENPGIMRRDMSHKITSQIPIRSGKLLCSVPSQPNVKVHVDYRIYGNSHKEDGSPKKNVCIFPSRSHDAIAITENSSTHGWADHLIGEGKCLDTDEVQVIVTSNLVNAKQPLPENLPKDSDLQMDDMALAQVDAMQQLGINKVDVVMGISMGAMVALKFAMMSGLNGVNVDKLLLIHGTKSTTLDTYLNRELQNLIAKAGRIDLALLHALLCYMSHNKDSQLIDPRSIMEKLNHIKERSREFDVESWMMLGSMSNKLQLDDKTCFSNLPHHVMIIGHKDDNVMAFEESKEMASAMKRDGKNVQLIKVDCDGGHDAVFMKKNAMVYYPHIHDFILEPPTNLPMTEIKSLNEQSLNERKQKMKEIHKNFLNTNSDVIQLRSGLWIKCEGENKGLSIKDRAMGSMIQSLLMKHENFENNVISICTSGSGGYSVYTILSTIFDLKKSNLKLVIAIPLSYKDCKMPQLIQKINGMNVYHGFDEFLQFQTQLNLVFIEEDFMTTLEMFNKIAETHDWIKLDQHYDIAGPQGHQYTAQEIMMQVEEVTDVVCATGTGATAQGLLDYLPKHVCVHSRPSPSGGKIPGTSDVRRYENFCETSKLQGYDQEFFDPEIAEYGMKELEQKYNISAAESTGAIYMLGKRLVESDPNKTVVLVSACGKYNDSKND